MPLGSERDDVQMDPRKNIVKIYPKNGCDSGAPLGLPRPRVAPRPSHTAAL